MPSRHLQVTDVIFLFNSGEQVDFVVVVVAMAVIFLRMVTTQLRVCLLLFDRVTWSMKTKCTNIIVSVHQFIFFSQIILSFFCPLRSYVTVLPVEHLYSLVRL